MTARHSKYAASATARWLACPGSVALADQAPLRGGEGEGYASEGTRAHDVAQALYERKGHTETDPEVIDSAAIYAAYLQTLPPGTMETRYVHPGLPNFGGTCDFWAFDGVTLFIVDFKHGIGVYVPARGNKQLRSYALLVCRCEGIRPSRVELTIVQPRITPEPETEVIEWEELLAFEEEVADAIDLIEGLERVAVRNFTAGPHCQFCPVLPICPSHLELAQRAAILMQNTSFAPETIEWVLSNKDRLSAYLTAVERSATAEVIAGTLELPGYKLVHKRGRRVWASNEDELRKAAGDHLQFLYAPAKLNTPAQVEKRIGREFVAAHATMQQGGLTLVPLSDNRPAAPRTAADDFSEVT